MTGPDYSNAGANRDKPDLERGGAPLRRALERHGFVWRADDGTLLAGDGGAIVPVSIGSGLQLVDGVLSATGGSAPTMSYFPASYTPS